MTTSIRDDKTIGREPQCDRRRDRPASKASTEARDGRDRDRRHLSGCGGRRLDLVGDDQQSGSPRCPDGHRARFGHRRERSDDSSPQFRPGPHPGVSGQVRVCGRPTRDLRYRERIGADSRALSRTHLCLRLASLSSVLHSHRPRRPGLALHSGDHVRVVVTPAQDGDAPGGTPEYSEAEVVAVHVNEETGETVVDLLVRHEDAAVLAARVATGHVALVLDSRDR